MANLTLKSKSFCSLSHNTNTQTSVFKTTTSFKNNSLPFLHSGNSLKFRVWCGIKEKENVKESESVPDELTGLKRADKLEPKRGSSLDFEQGFGNDSGSSEVGFYRKWPPWKNIPQRYKLIGSTSLAFVICNMDKVNLSIAIIPMSHQFGWNASTAGLVQSSFFWGYALSQLPGGWLAKIFGGRKVLQIGVLTWSVATALLPLLAGYMPGFVLSRVLVCAASSQTYVEQVFLPNLYAPFHESGTHYVTCLLSWSIGSRPRGRERSSRSNIHRPRGYQCRLKVPLSCRISAVHVA